MSSTDDSICVCHQLPYAVCLDVSLQVAAFLFGNDRMVSHASLFNANSRLLTWLPCFRTQVRDTILDATSTTSFAHRSLIESVVESFPSALMLLVGNTVVFS